MNRTDSPVELYFKLYVRGGLHWVLVPLLLKAHENGALEQELLKPK